MSTKVPRNMLRGVLRREAERSTGGVTEGSWRRRVTRFVTCYAGCYGPLSLEPSPLLSQALSWGTEEERKYPTLVR